MPPSTCACANEEISAFFYIAAGATEDARKSSSLGRGLVPTERQDELLAVFNGGWKPEHGRWGCSEAARRSYPLARATGTVQHPSRRRSGDPLERPTRRRRVARRLPPDPAVPVRERHDAPEARGGGRKPWGGRAKDVVTRRRSAVGVSRDGRFLFYAVGDEASPKWLAKALLSAGASTGAELDINWYWTRFLLFGEKDGSLGVTATLIPGMEYQ